MNDCPHLRTNIIPTPETIHHAKECCADCGRFLRWLPKPETLERVKQNQEHLRQLELARERLTEWECSFILSLQKKGLKFSPKQQEILDRLVKTHLVEL